MQQEVSQLFPAMYISGCVLVPVGLWVMARLIEYIRCVRYLSKAVAKVTRSAKSDNFFVLKAVSLMWNSASLMISVMTLADLMRTPSQRLVLKLLYAKQPKIVKDLGMGSLSADTAFLLEPDTLRTLFVPRRLS